MHILLVDDDKFFCELCREKLDFDLVTCQSISEAKIALTNYKFDIILLDYHLNDQVSSDALPLFKKYLIPIIMLTSVNDLDIQILNYQLGVTDYIVKPINFEILKLKLLNQLNNHQSTLQYKNISIDLQTLKINDQVKLTKNEYIILSYLIKNPQQTIDKKQLLKILWDNDIFVEASAFNVALMRLRKKIDCFENLKIETVKGEGIKLQW
ncbi:MAG: response regulator transcription factor [Mycoplasmatales bacterium]